MKIRRQLALLLLIYVLLFSGCAGNKDVRLAEDVVAKFHQLYNEQNYEEIFNTAHEEAKRTKSKEGLGLALAKAFEQYGKFISAELVFTKITELNPHEKQVELAYRSKFEKGNRNETFLIVLSNQTGALYGIGELTDEELQKLK